MASGITHILLAKDVISRVEDHKLQNLLQAGIYFFQVGSVGPDLPYASIADDDYFFKTESELADLFHYTHTNQLVLQAFDTVKEMKTTESLKIAKRVFCFFLGYVAHIVADGIIHPFVRDKVGDYSQNQTAHRVLEMNLDVAFYHHLTKGQSRAGELNYSGVQEELKNVTRESPEGTVALKLFSILIERVYGQRISPDMIAGWIEGLHRMFSVAAGTHPRIYRIAGADAGVLFKNYADLAPHLDEILLLRRPKDRDDNFLRRESVHFLDDCVPRYYQTFLPIASKAYHYVFKDGPRMTEADIPEIDLDTGRLLAEGNNLDNIPALWRTA